MLRGCSEECAKTLLLKAKPQVTLQKEDLLVPGQLCTDVYILITGSLQITLPSDDGGGNVEEMVPVSAMECAQPLRGSACATGDRPAARGGLADRSRCTGKGAAAASSAPLKGDRLRFRVVEKAGHSKCSTAFERTFDALSAYPLFDRLMNAILLALPHSRRPFRTFPAANHVSFPRLGTQNIPDDLLAEARFG
jgi:hypothetical protein